MWLRQQLQRIEDMESGLLRDLDVREEVVSDSAAAHLECDGESAATAAQGSATVETSNAGLPRERAGGATSPSVDRCSNASNQDMIVLESERLTVTRVCIHYALDACETGRPGRVLRAAAWIVLAGLILLGEVSVLMGLAIANNWRTCNDPASFPDGDCALGTVCAQVLGSSGVYRRPYCMDCFHVSDARGAPHPWAHQMVAERGVNGTSRCIEQLLAAQTVRYWVADEPGDLTYELVGVPPARLQASGGGDGHGNDDDASAGGGSAAPERAANVTEPREPRFGTCLYARAARENQSWLDVLLMLFAFVLLAADTAMDSAEHCRADFVRRRALPVRLPGLREQGSAACASGGVLSATLYTSACVCIKAIACGFSVAVPALIPSALIMLLLALGSGSTDVILNGLAVMTPDCLPHCMLMRRM